MNKKSLDGNKIYARIKKSMRFISSAKSAFAALCSAKNMTSPVMSHRSKLIVRVCTKS